MELGGNIELEGFTEDPNELIIIKKIVGNFTKQLSERLEVNKIIITHSVAKGEHEITGVVEADREFKTIKTANNLFFALTDALKELEKQSGAA